MALNIRTLLVDSAWMTTLLPLACGQVIGMRGAQASPALAPAQARSICDTVLAFTTPKFVIIPAVHKLLIDAPLFPIPKVESALTFKTRMPDFETILNAAEAGR